MEQKKNAGLGGKEDKLKSFADILNSIVYFLIFIIGLPILFGYVTSIIVGGITKETSFLSEYIFGYSLFVLICAEIPFSWIYIRRFSRVDKDFSLETWQLLPNRIFLIFVVPAVISIVYSILGSVLSFQSYNFLFPLLSITILPALLLLFFGRNTVRVSGWNFGYLIMRRAIAVLLLPFAILQIILTIIFSLKTQSVILISSILMISWLIYYLAVRIVYKRNMLGDKQQFGFISTISLSICFQTGVSLLMVVLVLASYVEFSWVHIVLSTLLLIKIVFVSFFLAQGDVYKKLDITPSTKISDALQVVLLLAIYIMVFVVFGISVQSSIPLVILCIIFAGWVAIEIRLNITNKTFALIFFFTNLIVIDLLISFLFIPLQFYLQLICFTVILIFIVSIMKGLKLITENQKIFIHNAIYVALFFELGLTFAIINESVVPITSSVVVNYAFYLCISSLASLYRLYFTQFKKKAHAYYGRIIIGHYMYLISVGCFILFQQFSQIFSTHIIRAHFQKPYDFLFFIREGSSVFEQIMFSGLPYLISLNASIANPNGVAVALISVAFVFVVALLLVTKIHMRYSIVSKEDYSKFSYIFKYIAIPAGYLIITTILPSLFGFTLGFLFILIDISMLVNQRFVDGKMPQSKYIEINNRLFLSKLIVSLVSIFLLFYTILGVHESFSLLIASIVLYIYQNYSKKVRSEIPQDFIRVVNGALLIVIAGLLDWSIVHYFSSTFPELFAQFMMTLVWSCILIVLVSILFALKQFSHIKNFTRERYFQSRTIVFSLSILVLYLAVVFFLIELINPIAGLNLICIFAPAFLSYFIFGRESKAISNIKGGKQALYLFYLSIMAFCYALIGTIIGIIWLLGFMLYSIFGGIAIISIALLFALNKLQDFWKENAWIKGEGVKNTYIIQKNVLFIISTVSGVIFIFFFLVQVLNFWMPLSLAISLLSTVILINTVPLFIKSIPSRVRHFVNAGIIFAEGLLVAMIINLFIPIAEEAKLFVYLLLALIPLVSELIYFRLAGNKFIEPEILKIANATLYILICGTVYAAVLTLSMRFLPLQYCIILAGLSLVALHLIDFYGLKCICNSEYFVLSLVFILLINFASILNAVVLMFFLPLDLHIILYLMLSIPLMEIILNVFEKAEAIVGYLKEKENVNSSANVFKEGWKYDKNSPAFKNFYNEVVQRLGYLQFSKLSVPKPDNDNTNSVEDSINKLNNVFSKIVGAPVIHNNVPLSCGRLRQNAANLLKEFLDKIENMDFKTGESNLDNVSQEAIYDLSKAVEEEPSNQMKKIKIISWAFTRFIDNLDVLEEFEKDLVSIMNQLDEKIILFGVSKLSPYVSNIIPRSDIHYLFTQNRIAVFVQNEMIRYMEERKFIKQTSVGSEEFEVFGKKFIPNEVMDRLFMESLQFFAKIKIDVESSLDQPSVFVDEEKESMDLQASSNEHPESMIPKVSDSQKPSAALRFVWQIKQSISSKRSGISLFLTGLAMICTVYLLIRIPISYNNYLQLATSAVFCVILALSLITRSLSRKYSLKELYTICITVIAYSYLVSSNVLSGNEFLSTILQPIILLVAVFIINYMITRDHCGEPVVKYLVNILIIGLYYYAVYTIPLPFHLNLLIIPTLFAIGTSKYYKNLTFSSLIVPIAAVVSFEMLSFDLIPMAIRILMPLTIAFVIEYKIMFDNKIWKTTKIKTGIGYITMLLGVVTFTLFNIYFAEFMRIVNPFIFGALTITSIILLKYLPKRKKMLTFTLYAGVMGSLYSLSLITLFIAYAIPEILAITFTLALMGPIAFIISRILKFQIADKLKKLLIFAATVAAFVHSYLLIGILVPTLEIFTLYSISIDISAVLLIMTGAASVNKEQSVKTVIWQYLRYIWIILPASNGAWILSFYQMFIDNISVPLIFFGAELAGSFILMLLTVSLLYIPVIISFIPKAAKSLFYVYWAQFILLFGWIGVNVLAEYPIIHIPFALLCSFAVLCGFYLGTKQWSLLMYAFPVMGIINIVLVALIPYGDLIWSICISFFVFGIYQAVYSFHPTIKEAKPKPRDGLRLSGFICTYLSLFYLVYLLIALFIQDTVLVACVTLIIMGFGLQIGKLVKLNSKVINLASAVVIYLDAALLIALYLIPGTFFAMLTKVENLVLVCKLWILAGILFVETEFVDRYIIKFINKKTLDVFTTLFYPLFVGLFAVVTFILSNNIWLSLTIPAVLLFYWTWRLGKAEIKFPIIQTNIILSVVVAVCSFLTFWELLNVSVSVISLDFRNLALTVIICTGIIYLFTLIGILPAKFNSVLTFVGSIAIGVYVEELIRMEFQTNLLMNISVFAIIATILNASKFNSSRKAYLFYAIISFCIGAITSQIIWIGFPPMSAPDNVLLMFFISGTIYSLITRILNDATYQSKGKSKEKLRTMYLRIGYPEKVLCQKFFVKWMMIYSVIFSLTLGRLWEYMYRYIVISSSDDMQTILMSITTIPLILCIYFALLLAYINAHKLWIDSIKISKVISSFTSIAGGLLYLLLPVFIAINFHYPMKSLLPPQYVLPLDLFTIFIVLFIAIEVIDKRWVKLLSEKYQNILAVISLTASSVSISSALFLLSDNIGLALLLFAIMVIKTPKFFDDKMQKILMPIPILLIYVGIALTGIIYTFRFAPANWSTLISLFIVQILVEIEIKWQKIGLLKSKYDKFHQVLISISTASNAITVALFTYPEFNVSLIFLAIGIVLVGLLYINRIRFREKWEIIRRNQSILGQLLYFDVVVYFAVAIAPLFNFTQFEALLWGLTIYAIYTLAVLSVSFVLLFLDSRYVRLIRDRTNERLSGRMFAVWAASLSLVCGYLFTLAMASLIQKSPDPQITEYVAYSFGTSAVLGVSLAICYKKTIINQLMYSISSVLLVLMIHYLDLTGAVIGVTIFLIVLYPFIFFLERIAIILKMLFDWLKRLFKYFIDLFQHLFERIAAWYRKNKKIFWFFVSIGASVAVFAIFTNPFGALLTALVLYAPFSPLAEKEITGKIFRNKVLYFAALYFVFMLFIFTFIAFKLWILLLFILLFFGGLLWFARYAERLYGISPIWRIVSAIIAIVMFALFILTLVNEIKG